MKKKYKDNLPANARIDINYKTGNVYFGYPEKPTKKGMFSNIYSLCLVLWLLLNLSFLLLYFGIVWLINMQTTNITTMGFTTNIITELKYTLKFLAVISVIMIYPFGIPFLFAVEMYSNYGKRYAEWFPKVNFWITKLFNRYKKIKINNLDSKSFEIPMFKNIILDYKLEGDFAKHINNIKVEEHPFKHISWKKEKTNNSLWKATFTFDETPKTGSMEVSYI